LSNAWVASCRAERVVVVMRRLMGSSESQHAGDAPAETTLGRGARSDVDVRHLGQGPAANFCLSAHGDRK
jgi:hypothetical protein